MNNKKGDGKLVAKVLLGIVALAVILGGIQSVYFGIFSKFLFKFISPTLGWFKTFSIITGVAAVLTGAIFFFKSVIRGE